MKIIMTQPRLDRRGGAENLVWWLARGLKDRRGHDVSILTRRFDAAAWASGDWDGIPVRAMEGRLDRALGRALKARRYAKLIEDAAADAELVVAHNFPSTVWATRHRAGPARRVWYCHEPMQRLHWRETLPTIAAAAEANEPWQRRVFVDYLEKLRGKRAKENAADRLFDKEAAAGFDAILANSAFTASRVQAIYGREARPCLLGLPPVSRVEQGPAEDAPYVAWVTSPLAYKNGVGMIEAARIAIQEMGAADLRVRAVGIDTPFYRQLASEAGLDARGLSFEPRLPYAELQGLIARARLLIYPTIDEPFGIVPLEAMAQGRPVVASRVGGPRESVVDGETGVFVDPIAPADIARGMLELWRDPARCDVLGAAGRKRFEAMFRLESFLDRFEEGAGIAGGVE